MSNMPNVLPIKFNSSIVVQHNRLIAAKFTSFMTEREQKIIAYIISETKQADEKLFDDNRNKDLNLSVSEFSVLLNVHPNIIYRDAAAIASSITKKSLLVQYIGSDDKEAFEEIVIIPYMKYESGVLTISVNSKILGYLLHLKGDYTKFKLENILRLESGYAIKIYQLLKAFEPWGVRKLEVQELKEMLGVSNKTCYKYYAQFKRDVLEISKTMINDRTDISFDYEEIKLKRSVGTLIFHIKSKMTQHQQALIGFEEFINQQPENSIMKILWDAGKRNREELMKKFSNTFKMWIEINCKEYNEHEIKPLRYESPSSLLYDEKANLEIIKLFHEENIKKK